MTIAEFADWLEREARMQYRFITGLPPGNMAEHHRRARLCVARMFVVQATALRRGYRFPSDPPRSTSGA